jgi:hypothetical protein
MPVALPSEDMLKRMSLSELKEFQHRVQMELSRRRQIGERLFVQKVMALASKYGWNPVKDGDAVDFIKNRLPATAEKDRP